MRHGIQCVDARVPAYVTRVFIIVYPAINNQTERLAGAKGIALNILEKGASSFGATGLFFSPNACPLDLWGKVIRDTISFRLIFADDDTFACSFGIQT